MLTVACFGVVNGNEACSRLPAGATMDEAFVVVEKHGCRLVTVRGDIHGASASAFSLACKAARRVVVDLSSCPYMDSSGLSALIAANRDGNLALVLSPAARIYRIFEVTQLVGHFRIAATVDEALAMAALPPEAEPLAERSEL